MSAPVFAWPLMPQPPSGDSVISTQVRPVSVHHDDVVEAFLSHGADHPLSDRVRPRRTDRRPNTADADTGKFGGQRPTVDRVSIVHKVPGLPTPRRGVDELLPDPGCSRTGRDAALNQFAAGVGDEEKHVERSHRHGLNDEKIQMPASSFTRKVRQR
jgi:hypothetical protein